MVRRHNLLVVADEVYEWHVYNGKKMIRFGGFEIYLKLELPCTSRGSEDARIRFRFK